VIAVSRGAHRITRYRSVSGQQARWVFIDTHMGVSLCITHGDTVMFHQAIQPLLPISSPIEFIKGLSAKRKAGKVKRAQRKAISLLRENLLKLLSADQLDLFAPVSQGSEEETVRAETAQLLQEIATKYTDEEVVFFADWFIQRHLELIRDSSSETVRRELITWFAPASDPDEPFSMAYWCRIAGHDPMEFSAGIRHMYREEIDRWLGLPPKPKAPEKVYQTLSVRSTSSEEHEEENGFSLAWE
jgi:hypothetical protein